jgi:hypothetical protein
MRELCSFIWCSVVGLVPSRVALQAEILVLRHQLNVLRRKSPERMALGNIERVVLIGLYRLAPKVLEALKIITPETVIRWHRAGFRAYWCYKSHPLSGRPKRALITLIWTTVDVQPAASNAIRPPVISAEFGSPTFSDCRALPRRQDDL